MTEQQRAAMRQALEAVKKLNSALAEQRAALDYLLLNHTQGELIARLKSSIAGVRLQTLDALQSGGASLNSLRAALAEPEPEPVAWIGKNGFRFLAFIEPQDDSETPLYTASPARRPLTTVQEAAPELLEALQVAADALCDLPLMDPRVVAIRAAIAKATGGNDE